MKNILVKFRVIPILILVLVVLIYGGNVGSVKPILEQSIGKSNTGEITDGVEIGQTFYSPVNNLSGISIKLATYMRQNNGEITLGIKTFKDKKTIYSTTVKAESVVDNSFFDFRFPPIKLSKGEKYYIFVKSSGSTQGNSITAYLSKEDLYKNGELFINNIQHKGDLVFKVFYNNTIFNTVMNYLN